MENGIIFGNRILDIVFVSWFIAQFWKVITSLIKERKINFKRFLESGGMPSSHTSSVTSLVTAIGILKGTSSLEFAITFVFAVIVMYDAAGVRRAAGKQAGILNKITKNILNKEGTKIIEENLKELIGHTPKEVFVGAILGIFVAFIMI
ncbi:MAG: acid phosphatase [Fusobacteriia bacterium 4572_132]|nr:MAG: acid phosphatase [Fusobacteriia bacterium 4572_132]